MLWQKIVVLCLVGCCPFSEAMPFDDSDDQGKSDDNLTILDRKLEMLDQYLTESLIEPWAKGASPILYIEAAPSFDYDETSPGEFFPMKRSRYYGKYPWKRQNKSRGMEKYVCSPSKEDVFRLLVALHETRKGNRGHVLNFCNRRIPASMIFSNIRVLSKN